VQVPAAKNEAVPAETVHTLVVAEVKVTGRPELAVALKMSGVPTVWEAIALKVMVCGLTTANDCEIEGAAA
jgi:hypothetical protein